MRGHSITAEQRAEMARMRAARASTREIAEALGLALDTVQRALKGVRVAPTAETDAMIARMWAAGASRVEICAESGVPQRTLTRRVSALGLAPRRVYDMTASSPERLEAIRERIARGMKLREIAKELGVTLHALAATCTRHGVTVAAVRGTSPPSRYKGKRGERVMTGVRLGDVQFATLGADSGESQDAVAARIDRRLDAARDMLRRRVAPEKVRRDTALPLRVVFQLVGELRREAATP